MARTVMNLLIAWCVASYVVGGIEFVLRDLEVSDLLFSPFWVPLGLLIQFLLMGNPELPPVYGLYLRQLYTFGGIFGFTMAVLAVRQSRDR